MLCRSMGKAIIKTYLQCSLLVSHLNGIIAVLWKYDLYHRKGIYVDTGILVGVAKDNNTVMIEKDSDNFIRHLELGETGYDLDKDDIHKLKLWPRGIIPYFIDNVSYEKDYRNNLRRMLKEINFLSGIHFQELLQRPINDKARFVYFINRVGSSCKLSAVITSTQFTNHGVQKVLLGYNSLSNGDLYGFVLAVAGIAPQNNAPNRDLFISVRKENILTDKLPLFAVLRPGEWLYHDLPYDYGSASHFRYHEYTKNGYATIRAKLDVPEAMGQGFTFYDILKMRRTYNYISDKMFKKVADPSKLSYMYVSTARPGVGTTPFPKGMNFGNPDEPKKEYDDYDDYEHKQPSILTSKYPRDKNHKFLGKAKIRMEREREDNENDEMFKAKDQDNKDEESDKHEKRISRPKPNKYLGLPGDEAVSDEEEYRPHHTEQVEVLSENLDVYSS